MTMTELDDRTPAEIERNIEATRASLKGKLYELEHRLSPAGRIEEMRQRIKPDAVVPWAAVGAIVTGAMLALRGLRRGRTSAFEDYDEYDDYGEMAEEVCVDVAVPPMAAP
ncbi:MAG TPA: DUF3618 domain-containing protein [Vicinamibacterales bacterium]|jgi:hypothetical protein|nr:DUF3618 domain-containing protein [Vicinamibacterales bacterium]